MAANLDTMRYPRLAVAFLSASALGAALDQFGLAALLSKRADLTIPQAIEEYSYIGCYAYVLPSLSTHAHAHTSTPDPLRNIHTHVHAPTRNYVEKLTNPPETSTEQ